MATVPLDDGTLWYEVVGDGPPLVCLHGGWQNAESWRPQIEHFADEYSVVTYDLRGHGQTGATDRRQYSIDLFVDDLERLLDHLGIERPIFAGVSIGGMILQGYLDRYPDGARGAVIGGPLRSMPPTSLSRGLKHLFSPVPLIAGMASTLGTRATFQSFLTSIRATTGKPWLTVDPTVRSEALATIGDITPGEYRKVFEALYEFVPPDLSPVTTPLLILYGASEAPPGKRQGRQIAETVAHGFLQEIPDAGHLVNQDNPRAFNDACEEFFDSLDSPDRHSTQTD